MINDESNSNAQMTPAPLVHSNIVARGDPPWRDSSLVISHSSLKRTDYLPLTLFATLLFGYVAISGRPMTMHEARLPQLSREMMQTHDYLVPHSGPRPWLERP